MLNRIKQAVLSKLQILDRGNQSHIVRIRFVEKGGDFSLLNWLKCQPFFPQFYFNFRDETLSCVGLGVVRSFHHAIEAEAFCQQEDVPLLGGCQFDGSVYFFLPRLFLTQQKNGLEIQLFLDGTQPWESELEKASSILAFFDKIQKQETLPKVSSSLASGVDKKTWCQWVEKARYAIQQQDFCKVVLANSKAFHFVQSLNPYDFLAKSEQFNPHCYHFLLAEKAGKAFVGSSPERLFLRNMQQLWTEALAGTAFVCNDECENQRQADWLLNDEKNIYENQLVVDNIQQSLASVLVHFNTHPCQVKKLRQVQHLQRIIDCQLQVGQGDGSCLTRMHPTAAVAGLPTRPAIDFIHKTELHSRGWYAGALGVMGKTISEFCVAIRSANICDDVIQIFAGAGIVANSVPEDEWNEIERKALGLVSLLET